MTIISTKDRIPNILRIQRDECSLVGIQLTDHKPLSKGESLSRELSGKYFKTLNDFGFSIKYDEFGKPWPQGKEGYVSISHTNKWLFLSFSSLHLQGLDIEHKRLQLQKIAPRILHSEEIELLARSKDQQSALQIFWGAKESLYKAYGRRSLEFKSNLRIYNFDSIHSGTFEGSILLPEGRRTFLLEWLMPDNDSWLVFVRKEITSPK